MSSALIRTKYPDELVSDRVVAGSESIDYEQGIRPKRGVRSLIASIEERPAARDAVLTALDETDTDIK